MKESKQEAETKALITDLGEKVNVLDIKVEDNFDIDDI